MFSMVSMYTMRKSVTI